MDKIVLSVVITTYQHEKYISQAIQSALSQETDFEYEVLVGVDTGLDKTEEIVNSFAQKYPEKVHMFTYPQRVGMFDNFKRTYEKAKGKYIALLEGDDYWNSKRKINEQVTLLQNNNDVVLCGHKTININEAGDVLGHIPNQRYPRVIKNIRFLENLCDFHTSSMLFRNLFQISLPPELLDERTLAYDLSLKFLLASRGNVGYIDQEMSVFRSISGSVSSSFLNERAVWIKAMIRSLRNIRPMISGDPRRILDGYVGRLQLNLAKEQGIPLAGRVAAVLRSMRWAPRGTLTFMGNILMNQAKRFV